MIAEEFEPDEPLFEGDPVRAITGRRTNTGYQDTFLHALKLAVPAVVGLVMIVFGLTTTGSYYTSASRFGGWLADIWYGWQAGTFLAIVGGILIYDAIKRTGYL